uniref:Kinesin 14-IIb protein n=1 Tax=Marsilea vestita TaxID=59764 RepID=A0A142KWC8_MARVE|nr:kinesin 14-IIb protein [Marsilea vestita]
MMAQESATMTPELRGLSFSSNTSSPYHAPYEKSYQGDHTPKNPDPPSFSIDVSECHNAASTPAEDGNCSSSRIPSESLSDVNLASRKANEAASRRYYAAAWLHKMVGPLDNLSLEPSEEELRLCLRNGLVLCNLINKIHPGAVLKIVDNPCLSSPPPQGAALSAYQYFENVRNFLVAVEELRLPSFQASDLEKGNPQSGSSSAKVVDCILALKAYNEWQLSGCQGLWKFAGGSYKSPCPLKSLTRTSSSRSSEYHAKLNTHFRKRSAFSGFEGPKNLFDDLGSPHSHMGKQGGTRAPGTENFDEYDNSWSSSTDFTTALIQHVRNKVNDVLHHSEHESPSDAPQRSSESLESIGSESLTKLVTLALNDKQPDEIPMIVECMLRKVMDEFETRLVSQEERLKERHSLGSEDPSLSNSPRDKDVLHEDTENLKENPELFALRCELEAARKQCERQASVLESQKDQLKAIKDVVNTTQHEFTAAQEQWKEEMVSLDNKLHGLAQAAAEYHKLAAENRELYNQVQDLKGNIRVYCRVRPFLPGQTNTQTTVDFVGEKGSIIIANPNKQGKDQRKSFNFNKVFGPNVAQEDVFLDTQPLIRSVLDGFNVCIFAYGQTGSGKTYTMTGPNNPTPKDWGVNFRALNDLFQISLDRKDFVKYEVGVQMMEIYNEQVRDLLSSDGSNKKLEIRNNSQQNGLNVPDATMLPVACTNDVLEFMNLGHKNRAVSSTALNERSSRSHSVLTVHVKGTDMSNGSVYRGCLHLVDLAGSERVDRSEVTGDRLKEAQHINKSLSALGDVIAALAQKNSHVPYRNSKLTQLLQDSLGGQAKTLMFVHISPDEDSYAETISTLKFAERVATVELGAASSHKESGEVRDLKDQVSFLRDALSKKDAEIERMQKELKAKPLEAVQEKSRAKTGTPPSVHTQSRKIGVDVTQGQGKRRQPLEEVRNSELRVSPLNVGIAQKYIPGTDIHPMEALSPGVYGNGFYEEDFAKRKSEDVDSIKKRGNKLPRATSEEEADSPVRELMSDRSINKNKISRENTVETQLTPRESTRLSRTVSALNVDTVTPKSTVPSLSSITSIGSGGAVSRLRQSNLKPVSSNMDVADLLDDSNVRERMGLLNFEEDSLVSDCSDEAEAWQKEPITSAVNPAKVNRRPGVPGVKQSLSSLPKTDSKNVRSSRRISSIGTHGKKPVTKSLSNTHNTTTVEAKVVAAG